MVNEVSIPTGVKFIYAPLRDGTPCLITNMSGGVLFQNPDVSEEDCWSVSKSIHLASRKTRREHVQ